MCGIAGLFASDRSCKLEVSCLRRMSDTIAHRGPDGEGIFEAPGVALAHRRLAIIDLNGGGQPMVSREGSHAIVFNGEIYNYRELRIQLQEEGVEFRTNSDTEVVLEGWRTWGGRVLDRLRGMFAFAIYDRSDDALVLARDHFGIKPLFYARLRDGTVAFASELKALRVLGDKLDKSLRRDAIVDYFTFGYVPDSKSIYRGVSKLQAAHSVRFLRGREGQPKCFWRPGRDPTERIAPLDAIHETLAVIDESIRAHLVADVPVSSFLSGGVDSGIVTALAAKHAPGLLAHTISFENPRFDESSLAAQVAQRHGVNHRIHRVGLPRARDVLDVLSLYDEPYADSSCIPTLALCRAAAVESKVALSGDGGDEQFGGYQWYLSHLLRSRFAKALPRSVATGLGALGSALTSWRCPSKLRIPGSGFMTTLGKGIGEGFVASQVIAPYASLQELLSGNFLSGETAYSPHMEYGGVAQSSALPGSLQQAREIDMNLYLPGDILTKVDRASMNCGLEVRVPFLDRRVFDWVARIPTETILLDGRRKGLLIAVAEKFMPKTVVSQPKRGFSVPLDDWFRADLMRVLEEQMNVAGERLDEIVNREFVKRIIERHQAGRLQAGSLLFALLSLSLFLQRE